MTPPQRVVVLIATQPGRGADQHAAFAALAPLVRAEPGCLRYDLHAVEDDPDRFVLLEEWESAEALAAHGSAPHMQAAAATNAAFRAGPADVYRITPAPVA